MRTEVQNAKRRGRNFERVFNLVLADREDRTYLTQVAREMKYRSTSSFLRAILNGYFKLMGMRKLKPCYPTCAGVGRPVCKKGHPFTPENTYWRKRGDRYPRVRLCRICYRAMEKRARDRKRERLRAAVA